MRKISTFVFYRFKIYHKKITKFTGETGIGLQCTNSLNFWTVSEKNGHCDTQIYTMEHDFEKHPSIFYQI